MLKTRIVTASVLAGAFAAALFGFPAIAWTALMAIVIVVAAWEWAGFARLNATTRIIYAVLLTVTGLLIAMATRLAEGGAGVLELLIIYGTALFFWIIVAPLWLRLRPASPSRVAILVAGWIVLVPAYLGLVQLRNIHPLTLLAFMLVVWIADIAAYFSGRRFGRRKLAPRISPGKTWEGLYGALAANGLYAILWTALGRQHSPAIVRDLPSMWLWMILLVIALTLLSVIGDLFESSMKRQAGLKDSSAILPGHGGVLDRIDALTPVLPTAALVSMI
jgi:phosphatidate cytidylyltransferase